MRSDLFPIFVSSGKSKDRFRAGFVDIFGNVLIDPVFDSAEPFREGLAPVQVDRKWGLIDQNGAMEFEPFSLEPCRFYEGKAMFSRSDKQGIIDRKGRIVVPERYYRIGSYREGMAWMSNPGAWRSEPGSYGFLDADGNEKIPFFFDDVRGFREGVAAVKLAGKWGFISPDGNFVIPAKFDFAVVFCEKLARVETQGRWGFVNHSGDYVIEPRYETALDFNEGLAPVKMDKLWGFINRQGEFQIPPVYRSPRGFSSGVAAVKTEKGATIYIDESGKQVFREEFSDGTNFYHGLALIERSNEIGYINLEGKSVWTEPYLDIAFAFMSTFWVRP